MCWDEDDMFWFEEEKSVYPEAKLYQFISATDRGRAAVAYIILPLYQIFLQSPLLLDIFWNNALLGQIQYTLHREQALSQPCSCSSTYMELILATPAMKAQCSLSMQWSHMECPKQTKS